MEAELKKVHHPPSMGLPESPLVAFAGFQAVGSQSG